VVGDTNLLQNSADNVHVSGDLNTIWQNSGGTRVTGDSNTVQQASGGAVVLGSSNMLSHGSANAQIQGSGNTVSYGSRAAAILGDDNDVEHGSTSAAVRGGNNTVLQTANANVTGGDNYLLNVSATGGDAVTVQGSSNYLAHISAPSVTVLRSGASIVSSDTSAPVSRRRLTAATFALVVADLSGNQLTWTCDPDGVAGPPNSAASCAALEALYRSAGGLAWQALDKWPTRNYCTSLLPGLGCSRSGNVTSLLLNASGLTGALPAALGDLAALTALDVSSNALSGALPTSTDALAQLTSLCVYKPACARHDSRACRLTQRRARHPTGTLRRAGCASQRPRR
jgi:hypothetical protein